MDIKEFGAALKKAGELNQNLLKDAGKVYEKEQDARFAALQDIGEQNKKKHEAILVTAEILRDMNAKMEEERSARVAAEEQLKNERKADRFLAGAGITIGLLTLIATVLLGTLALLN